MPLTFRQFVCERWGRILLGSAAYIAAFIAVNMFCPRWVTWLWDAIVCCLLSYHWGVARERERCWKELLATRELHRADLDRFVAYLRERRGYVDRMHGMIGQAEPPKEQAN